MFLTIDKGGDTNDPKNYRPITCLNLILKIFTSILKRRIEITLKSNDDDKRISLNQLGCKQYSYASKEGLLQNTLLQAMLNKRMNWLKCIMTLQRHIIV